MSRTPTAPLTPRAFLAGGGLLVFLAVYLMPWVRFVPSGEFDQRMGRAADALAPLHALEPARVISRPYHLDLLHDPEGFADAYATSPYKPLYELVASGSSASGWDFLILGAGSTGGVLRGAVAAALAVSLFSVLVALLGSLRQGKLTRVLITVLSVLSGALVLLFVALIPVIDNFGIYRDPALATLLYLGNARIDWGVPVLFLALLAISINAAIMLSTPPDMKTAKQPPSRRSIR